MSAWSRVKAVGETALVGAAGVGDGTGQDGYAGGDGAVLVGDGGGDDARPVGLAGMADRRRIDRRRAASGQR